MEEAKKIPAKVSPKPEEKEKKPEPKKVTTGDVSIQKKSIGQKLAQTFVPGDLKSVAKWAWKEIAVPMVKRTLDELISQGAHMMLYPGDTSTRRDRRPGDIQATFDYGRQYRSRSRDSDRPRPSSRWAEDFELDRIKFSSRTDADMVLRSMDDQLADYPFVRVSDFYEYAGITTDNYQLPNWGWTSLREATVERNFDGSYYICFPRPMPID